MLFSVIASTVSLLTLTLIAAATPIFQNTGTTSGWDFINSEHHGTVQQVSNVYLNGPTALKMTQVYDPSYTGRYHSEVGKQNIYKLGDTGFYGFAFRLQQDWEFDSQSYNLAQFIADFSDTGCDDFMPSSMVWIVGDQLYSRVKRGSVCGQKTQTFANLATVGAGEWHTVIIQASWRSDNMGFYKIWFDGAKVLEKYDLATMINETRPFQYRVGLYANGWHDEGVMKGGQGTRSVWYDSVAAGSTFADVDPGQWDKPGGGLLRGWIY